MKIPKQNLNPLQYMGHPVPHTIFLSPVTHAEINQIIMGLKNGAVGYDEITAVTLQLVSLHIIEPLMYICNLSLNQGIFPTEMKLANVIPLYEANNPDVFNNYRPVSLLCTLSKVLERVMYSRLIEYLETFKISLDNQFGFRKWHSSYMALIQLMDQLIKSLEKGETVIGVFLDFSKAFDTVDHDILLKKMEHYGIRGCALSWFKIYPANRKQFVTYNGVSSTTKNIRCGVPQGSILGPLLFLIYINDLYSACKDTTAILFADDTNLFKSGKDINSMERDINDELRNISVWLKNNKLFLNVDKTYYMILSRKKNWKEKYNFEN